MGTVPFSRPSQTRINKGLSRLKINFDTILTIFSSCFIVGKCYDFFMLKIRLYPDPILREKCQEIKIIDQNIENLAKEMLETMYKEDGVGLAAPQIGKAIRLIVLDIGKEPIALANPKIVKKRGISFLSEGCLSLPGKSVIVKRAAYVKVKGIDPWTKEKKEYIARGLLAHDFQHEIDHLNGILIIDY